MVMQVAVYIKENFYKNIEVEHPEKYNVSDIIKQVHIDRDAGLIPDWNPGERLPVKIVPVK